ncbi:hypothetical protein CAB17_20325 (plasmid) [Legionella sainthelensi]|uniref:Uncharacterized protein n=1 Tax=Legionella sainthelensi TaxID=28087 RepID=A0A2H5FRW0_9GAMM|nr:hypothetical protein CAB17_20325 [Legionella sainthelensi]
MIYKFNNHKPLHKGKNEKLKNHPDPCKISVENPFIPRTTSSELITVKRSKALLGQECLSPNRIIKV